MASNSIVLIVAYFGKFPEWFDLYLASCKYNPTITWLIFTDDQTEYQYPKNVVVKYTTFSRLKNKIQSLYNIPIKLNSPYKLCDFKVAYGEIFQDEIKDFDYWGYCDVDVIWGNLRHFITDEVLVNYDKILASGHLTIFKNNEFGRTGYRTMSHGDAYYWKDIFSSDKNFAFDEWGKNRGINRILLDNGFKLYNAMDFADIRVDNINFRLTKEKYSEKKEYYRALRNSIFSFEEGTLKLVSSNNSGIVQEEMLYVHFQKRHMKKKNQLCSMFCIRPNEFVDWVNIGTVCELKKFYKEKNNTIYYFVLRGNNFVKKIKRLSKK